MTKILVGESSLDRDTLKQNWCPLKSGSHCIVIAFECGYGPLHRHLPVWCPLPLTISQESEEKDTPFHEEVRRRMALDPLDSRSIEEAIDDTHTSREKSD